jgi:hypothetical protein
MSTKEFPIRNRRFGAGMYLMSPTEKYMRLVRDELRLKFPDLREQMLLKQKVAFQRIAHVIPCLNV